MSSQAQPTLNGDLRGTEELKAFHLGNIINSSAGLFSILVCLCVCVCVWMSRASVTDGKTPRRFAIKFHQPGKQISETAFNWRRPGEENQQAWAQGDLNRIMVELNGKKSLFIALLVLFPILFFSKIGRFDRLKPT